MKQEINIEVIKEPDFIQYHITSFKKRINSIKTVLRNIEEDLIYINSHKTPISDNEQNNITVNDVYVEKHALERKITDLENYLITIRRAKLGMRVPVDLKIKISDMLKIAKLNLIKWDKIKTIDSYSDETLATFTGSINATWYGEPLRIFLQDIFSSNKEITNLKELLRYINLNYDIVDHISVKYYGDYSTIPKSILVALLQQLILIDVNKPDRHDTHEVRVMKRERVNRGMYKIHVGYQLDPKTIMDILNENGIIHCETISDVMDKSSIHMMKDPPKWAKDVIVRDNSIQEMRKIYNEQNKQLVKEREKLKKSFLHESYGKRADMKDVDQDRVFVSNLEKYHNNEFTRIKHLDTVQYDKLINNIKTTLGSANA